MDIQTFTDFLVSLVLKQSNELWMSINFIDDSLPQQSTRHVTTR
jgi:hypothetical protein